MEKERSAKAAASLSEANKVRKQIEQRESPEVLEVIKACRESKNKLEYDAFRKRRGRASRQGLSAAEFEMAEVRRARSIVRDQRRLGTATTEASTNNDLGPAARRILDERFNGGSSARNSYQHRLANSQQRGETPAQFELIEIARARHLAKGKTWHGAIVAATRKEVTGKTGNENSGRHGKKPEAEAPKVKHELVVHQPDFVLSNGHMRDELHAADEMFTRVGSATDTLFPDRVPSDRIIEVAEWQVNTIRMLQR